MAAQKVLSVGTSGELQEVAAVESSTGAGSEGKLVALNAAGQIDPTMLAAAGVTNFTFSEAVVQGAMVNLWNSAGTVKARNADNSAIGKKAHGFAPAAVASGAVGAVEYPSGYVAGLTGLTLATEYFLGTAGAITLTPPTAAASIVQKVGFTDTTGTLICQIQSPIVRA